MKANAGLEGLPGPGAVIVGKYEVVRVLGRGGMGVVVQARHLRMERDVALKILLPVLREQPEVVARFEREGRAAAQLHDPHVTRVLDVDTLEDGSPFIVMELLRGEDLADILQKRGPLPARDAVGYLLEACSAMAEAHRAGVIHRDLKPNNLFVDRQGERPVLKVLDFGISKVTGDLAPSMTATATAFGTPLYMSPEQVRSAKNVDGRADIWSLGVVLYELLTGVSPFAADSPTAILAAIIADAPVPVAQRRPDLPRPLADAVMRALEKDAAARFSDVESFAAAIAPFGPAGDGVPFAIPSPATSSLAPAAVATASTNVPPRPVAPAPAPTPARAPVVPIAMGMLLAIVASVVLFAAVGRRNPQRPPASARAEATAQPAPSTPAPVVEPLMTAAPLVTAAPIAVETATAAPSADPTPPRVPKPQLPSEASRPTARPGAAPPATPPPGGKPTAAPVVAPQPPSNPLYL